MTPKEKAKELVDRFFNYVEDGHDYRERQKQCALIVVKQIETITKHYPPKYMLTTYCKEVKQEIEKL